MNLKKVSKTIKANITGIGGSRDKLYTAADSIDVTTENQNERAVNNNNNYIGPLHSQSNHIFLNVREEWKWVMEDICARNSGDLSTITRVDETRDLPSGKLASVATHAAASHPNNNRSSRRRNQKNTAMTDANCTLRVEIISNTRTHSDNFRPWTLQVFHCTSQAFDGLDDKDELARTLKRCRCEDLDISPPSQLINWDVTKVNCN